MAGTKISAMTGAGALTGAEEVPVVQSGGNVKTTTQDIADLVSAGWGYQLVTGTSATLPDANTIVEFDPASTSTTLTLPTPSAGRTFIIRKIDGADTVTITLARAGSEKIDYVAASRVLTGSDTTCTTSAWGRPVIAWLVWSDGTDWKTSEFGATVRHQARSSAPDDSTHTYATETGGYVPGSTWYDSTNKMLYVCMSVPSLGTVSWDRVDAVDVETYTSDATLPSKDRNAFVDSSGGAVVLTLPSPTGRNKGRQYSITKTDTGTNLVSLARTGSENINGVAATFDLPGSDTADYGRWHVVSDGTDWWVVGGAGLTA